MWLETPKLFLPTHVRIFTLSSFLSTSLSIALVEVPPLPPACEAHPDPHIIHISMAAA